MERERLAEFQETVWEYYAQHGRSLMPWRRPSPDGSFDAYKVMVSEIMLQQTQVARVTIKYQEFITRFPTLQTLASADLGSVLRVWQGLGYNRRAKFIWQAAQMAVEEYDGILPQDIAELVKFPGIGKNTAGAIIAYTWSQPVVYIETNIRTVYIYHFFQDSEQVSDNDIAVLLQKTIPSDAEHTREWYWALMDYGQFIKHTQGNLNKLSKSYNKQSVFKGSRRQVRGEVLRFLATSEMTKIELLRHIADERLDSVLNDLVNEQIISLKSGKYQL